MYNIYIKHYYVIITYNNIIYIYNKQEQTKTPSPSAEKLQIFFFFFCINLSIFLILEKIIRAETDLLKKFLSQLSHFSK